MKFTNQFAGELLSIGIATVVVGLIVTWIVMKLSKTDESNLPSNHWKYCAIVFFFTGVLIHFLYELSGWNSWYCKNGNACKSA